MFLYLLGLIIIKKIIGKIWYITLAICLKMHWNSEYLIKNLFKNYLKITQRHTKRYNAYFET